MEEIERSGIQDESGMISKLDKKRFSDKTLEVATRVYDNEAISISNSLAANSVSEFDFEVGVNGSQMNISNPIIGSQKELEEVDNIAEEVGLKGVEKIPKLKSLDMEVSENGASIFDEIFGPPSGNIDRNENFLEEKIESERSPNNDGIGENVSENPVVEVLGKEEEATLCDGYKFLVGDLVWVQTKTKSWWPGKIIDPSYVCNNVARKPSLNASLLVKYFGNYPSVWCTPMQLKPFAENFADMSSKGTSKVFLSAVKKAVDEFGRQMKAQMTCPCEQQGIKEETVFLDKKVLDQFEPVNFLYLVKNLVWNESKIERLELVKIRNHLSAFYCSLGHHQLPLNQLHDTTDEDKHSAKRGKKSRSKNVIGDRDSEVINTDTYPEQISEVKSEKGSESRERKRSKYLSYPYTTNDVAVCNSFEGQNPVSSRKVKRSDYKLYTRIQIPTYKPKAPIGPGDLNTSSVDLLSKLRLAAVDYIPIEGGGFDLVDRFSYGFRKWVFLEKYDPEVEHKQEGVDKCKNDSKVQVPFGNKPLTSNSYPVLNPKRKSRKKNEKSTTNYNVGFMDGFKSQEPVADKPSVPKLVQTEISVRVLPDLNKSFTNQNPFVENSQANHITTPVNRPVQSKKKKKVQPFSGRSVTKTAADMNVNYSEDGSFVQNVKIKGPHSAQNVIDDQSGKDEIKLNGSSLAKDSWVMGLQAPVNSKPEAVKRKQKEKRTKIDAQASTIPDLKINAKVPESSSLEKVLPETKSALGEVKSPKKRKRINKVISPKMDLNPCLSEVHINEESSGTALVLTFAQGFPVPSKEALIATFCGFGAVNEAETKGLSDNKSAQIVFKNVSHAVEALKGVEKKSPFGPVLIKCQLRNLSTITGPIGLKPCELKANK